MVVVSAGKGLALTIQSAAPSLENPNHAVIIGWDEIDDLHRREQADMLAERAFFVQAG